MIRVRPAPEPVTFHVKVREPGLRAISEMVGERPNPPRRAGRPFAKIADTRELIPAERFPDYWKEALDDLMGAYGSLCAYSCFRIHPVTGARSVDHMVAKSRAWDHVYEWTNYRLACSRLNARKNALPDVLDPFEIQDDWFELELVGFQVKPRADLPEPLKERIRTTIDRLGLNDFSRDREKDALYYWSGDVSLAVLREESPFVARELQRQGQLLPRDA